ncbi:unnamed protein product, partial [marine sediment metagenome]
AGTEIAHGVIEHSIDQGLVLVGWTDHGVGSADDMMLIKTNSVGVMLWTKTYGVVGQDFARSVVEHSIDKGFALVGQALSIRAGEFMLVKTDSVGAKLWSKTLGFGGTEYPFSVIEHSIDNGFVIAGRTDSVGSGSDNDFVIIKTDTVGVELWTKTFGGVGDDLAKDMIEHSIDQGLVIAGYTGSYGAGSNDMMLVV